MTAYTSAPYAAPTAAPGGVNAQDFWDIAGQVAQVAVPIALSFLSAGPGAQATGRPAVAGRPMPPQGLMPQSVWSDIFNYGPPSVPDLTNAAGTVWSSSATPQPYPAQGATGNIAPQSVPWGQIIQQGPEWINAIGNLIGLSAAGPQAVPAPPAPSSVPITPVPRPQYVPAGFDINQLISAVLPTVISALAANPALAAARQSA